MDNNTINKLFNLEFYKKQGLWTNKKISRKRTMSDADNDPCNSGSEQQPLPPRLTDQNNAQVISNTAMEVAPADTNGSTSMVVNTSQNNVGYRTISSKLELFVKLSSKESESQNVVKENLTESTLDLSDPISQDMDENADYSEGDVSELTSRMLELYSEDIGNRTQQWIFNNKTSSYARIELGESSKAGAPPPPPCGPKLMEQTYENWLREHEKSCGDNGYISSLKLNQNSVNENSNDSFAMFTRGAHDVPHSSLKDLSDSKQMTSGYLSACSDYLSPCKLAEMSMLQLENNMLQVLSAWTKMMQEKMRRVRSLGHSALDDFSIEQPSSSGSYGLPSKRRRLCDDQDRLNKSF